MSTTTTTESVNPGTVPSGDSFAAVQTAQDAKAEKRTRRFRLWRGDQSGGELREYATEVAEGMVVLDAVHRIQAESANDLAVRWNCKAGKCGSFSAEINGKPRLMCMTRLNELPDGKEVYVQSRAKWKGETLVCG